VSVLAPTDKPGEREAAFHDPWENRWWVATRSAVEPAE
jgi:hypothetical protein